MDTEPDPESAGASPLKEIMQRHPDPQEEQNETELDHLELSEIFFPPEGLPTSGGAVIVVHDDMNERVGNNSNPHYSIVRLKTHPHDVQRQYVVNNMQESQLFFAQNK